MTDHDEILKKLKDLSTQLDKIQEKVDPMYDIFDNSRGFVTITILAGKALLFLAAIVGAIYGALKWLKG